MTIFPLGPLCFDFLRETLGSGFFLSLGFLRIFALSFAGSICCESVNESNDNLLDIDFRVKLGGGGEERAKGVKVEFICEDLDDHLHQIFLSYDVLAVDDLFENAGKDGALVLVEIDTVELAEPYEICPHEDAQFASLQFAFFTIAGVTLMLKSYPKFVHFNEISENE